MGKTLLNITFGPGERINTLDCILEYYEGFDEEQLPYIVITNQSENPLPQRESPAVKEWRHYPVSKFTMYEMWIDVINTHPNHEYFCWNNDDDITIPQGIKQAEDFLDKNKDYSVVQGEVIKTIGHTENLPPYGQSTWFQVDRNEENVKKRFKEVFTHLHANPHSLFRSSTFKNACNLCIESYNEGNNFGALRFWDKVLCYVAAVDGKRKTNLDCLFSVRSDRAVTKQIAHIAETYHQILERETTYEEIFIRFEKADNLISRYFFEKTGEKISVEELKDSFNPANIGFGVVPTSDIIPPHLRKDGKKEIKKIVKLWNKYLKQSIGIGKRFDVLIKTLLGRASPKKSYKAV